MPQPNKQEPADKQTPADKGDILDDVLDMLGMLRYDIPMQEKERLALRRTLPGAPAVQGTDAPEAQRYAAGYLHGKAHPEFSRHSVPAATFLRALLLRESPELMSFAQQGANLGRMEK